MTVNKKHVLFIGLLLLLMVSVQGVMAENLESTADNSISEISDSINCENDVASIQMDNANNDINSEMDQPSVSESDSLEETFADNNQSGDIKKSPLKTLAAGEPGSFTELQALINENAYGTLSLDKDYSYFSGDSAIQISSPIVINGNGFTLDGGNQVGIFRILAQDVVLNDLRFVKGNADYGGAIWISASYCTISNSVFEDNSAYFGGAILISAHYCSINKSRFEKNEAYNYGGAVYVNGHVCIINNTEFKDNEAYLRGGALYVPNVIVKVEDSNFTGNRVQVIGSGEIGGGAIFAATIYGRLLNCTFKDNDACEGGAVYGGFGKGIINSTFENNHASYQDGGALYLSLQNGSSILDCTFRDNDAQGYGGAIYVAKYNSTISDSKFENNYAYSSGGAVYLDANGSELVKSTFVNNEAKFNGGSVCIASNKNNITDSTFIENTAQSGGAIYVSGMENMIVKSTFDRNFCEKGSAVCMGNNYEYESNAFNNQIINSLFTNNNGERGAVYVISKGNSIRESKFIENEGSNGGAICWEGEDGAVISSEFSDNYAIYYGGAVKWDGSNGFISDCKFYYNFAGNGGAVKIGGDGFELQNSEFYYNVAGEGGGAIYFSGDDGIIKNVVFDSNSANSEASQGEGGALFSYGYNLLVDNSIFRKNSAWNYEWNAEGGAVRVMGDYTRVMNSLFEENYANAHGGAINWFGSNGVLYNSTFDSNTANTIGGAVYWSGHDAFIDKSRFWNNNVTYYTGGAVAFETSGYINNSEFINNIAHKGGALHILTYDNCIVNNSYFSDNYAIYAGAGISCDYYYGGSIKIIDNCKFENNEAHNYGGAVASLDTEIRNSQFISNKAHMGGAIHTFESKIIDSSFSANKADYGNDLYCYKENVLYTDSSSNGKMSSFKYNDEDVLGAVSPLLAVSSDEKLVSSNIEQVPGELLEIVSEIGNSTRMTNISYVAICVERNTYFPKYGTKDDTLRNLINYKTGEYIGDYLKIMVYMHFNSTDDIYPHEGDNYGKPRPDYYSTAVHVFSDGDFRNSDNPLVVEVLKLYDSGFRVPNQAYKHVANNTYLRYNFSSMISPASQSLFIFNIDTVERNETEDENETNKTNPPVNETVPPEPSEPSEPPEKPLVHPPVDKKIPHVPVSSEATGNPLFLLILAIMMLFTQFKPKK